MNQLWVSLPTWGKMERLNLPFFYQIGYEVHRLANIRVVVDSGLEVIIAFCPLQQTLRTLFERFPSLKISQPKGAELLNLVEDFLLQGLPSQKYGTLDFYKPINCNPHTFQTAILAVITKANEFQTALKAELESFTAYQVTQTGIYSVSDLVDNAENVIPANLKEKLSRDVHEEIRQSGRCLAFGVATASGFHILRATEAVVYQYYKKVCNQGNDCAPLDNWGAYIACFRESNDTDAKRIGEMLQQVKDHDRNLIMHPEVSLSEDEAHILFEVAKGAIMAMAEKL